MNSEADMALIPVRPLRLAGAIGFVALAIQFVPYGRPAANPATIAEPRWDSALTRSLAKRACFDCHSNETRWPAYSRIAPVSWLIRHDVDEGRAVLNFSEWHRFQEESAEAAEVVQKGEMPPGLYLLMHTDARLSDADIAALRRGLEATIGAAPAAPNGQ
jgi:hypothetical protein